MSKENKGCVYVCVILSRVFLKNRNSIVTKTWKKLENIILREINQVQENKCCMISVIYGTLKSQN